MFSKKNVDIITINPITKQATIPCKIELYVSAKSLSPISRDIMELVPMPIDFPKLIINVTNGTATPIAKNDILLQKV